MDTKTIATQIKTARQAKGYTIEYVADEIGISTSAYGRIERGETSPPFDKLLQICAILEINPHSFLGENEDKKDTTIEGIDFLKKQIKLMETHLSIMMKSIQKLKKKME